MSKKIVLMSFAALFVFLFANWSEAAVKVRRMGNPSTRFYSPDLKSEDDFRKMVAARKDAIRTVVASVGWTGSTDDLLNALESGTISETTISSGSTVPFMAYRKRGRVGAVRDVTYTGPSVEAYYVDFESAGRGYRAVFPKICSNFWVEDREIPVVEAPPPVVEEPPPPPMVETPPPPPEVAPPPVEMEAEGPGMFFLAGLIGKERRTIFTQGPITAADCMTLLGVKAGVLPRLGDNLEAELSAGVKIVISDDDEIGERFHVDGPGSALFVDAALHALFDGGFIGGGVSFWDLSDSDFRTTSLLLQAGFGGDNVSFLMEARAPFEDLDDLGNNYMFWGGIRIRP